MIISTRNPLASSHGGLVTQFGKLFVLTGEIDREVGKELKLALELRAKARYRPEAKLSRRDAKFVIDLAEKLSDIARKKAVKISTYGKHRLVGTSIKGYKRCLAKGDATEIRL